MSDVEPQESNIKDNEKEQSKLNPEAINSIKGNNTSKDGWEDHGVIDVPVADLPEPEGVNGPDDFDHHISWEDAKSASEQLPGIQQEMKSGKSKEDFIAEDRKKGLDYAHGKERIFDLYYGSDPITVDKAGDKFTIISGRHRIYAAKAVGLDSLPVRLREKMEG